MLRGWYLPPRPAPPTTAPGLVWFPGNAETVASLAPLIRELRPPGVGMLILDYRGYGESSGKPTEAGLYRDAEAAWGWLAAQPEIDRSRIAVYGRSLGAVAALHVAVTRQVRAVVLHAPFTSARDMARRHYWYLPRSLLRLELDNLDRARRLRAPLLVIHGTADGIVPFEMGRAIARPVTRASWSPSVARTTTTCTRWRAVSTGRSSRRSWGPFWDNDEPRALPRDRNSPSALVIQQVGDDHWKENTSRVVAIMEPENPPTTRSRFPYMCMAVCPSRAVAIAGGAKVCSG